MSKPIMEFKDQEQANMYLKEWQTRLFLDDWVIKISLVEPYSLIDENNESLSGQNEFQIENKCCSIKIEKLNNDTRNRIMKVCHEKVLIHELLHCKYVWLCPPNTMEGKYFEALEHGLLEQMAKSLLMAKYNLTFDWFKNF